MTSTEIFRTLGDRSVDEFMARFWQRKPLLVRQAIPGFTSPISASEVFELAGRDDIEARLVSVSGGRWSLQRGPFEALPSRRKPDWTVLVNGIDRHLDAAHDLLRRFRFLPDARLDDLMVSFATDGGGVGPHVDSYDVFLLQAQGCRRWRLAPPGDTELVAGAPLKILKTFQPQSEWTLEPGDMLYVPPGWGHEGTALGECMTLSVGFRAPSRREFLSAFLSAGADAPDGPDPRFSDRGLPATRHPGELPRPLGDQLRQWAMGWRPRAADVDRFVGCFLTEPAADVWFETPDRPPVPRMFADRARRQGLVLDRRTRMAWRGTRVFINGETVDLSAPGRAWLRRLADRRELSAAHCDKALTIEPLAMMLHEWLCNGWLHIARAAHAGRRPGSDHG